MADNPNKKAADAKRVSQQPHEKAYQKSKAKQTEKDPGTILLLPKIHNHTENYHKYIKKHKREKDH